MFGNLSNQFDKSIDPVTFSFSADSTQMIRWRYETLAAQDLLPWRELLVLERSIAFLSMKVSVLAVHWIVFRCQESWKFQLLPFVPPFFRWSMWWIVMVRFLFYLMTTFLSSLFFCDRCSSGELYCQCYERIVLSIVVVWSSHLAANLSTDENIRNLCDASKLTELSRTTIPLGRSISILIIEARLSRVECLTNYL